MKKYISPIATCIEVSAEGFLAGSTEPENNINNKVSNNAALSNQRSIWNED